MRRGGRPLRFLVLVFGAWIGLRSWQLWPDPPVPAPLRAVVRRVVAARRDERLVAVIVARPARRIVISAGRPGGRSPPVPRAATAMAAVAPTTAAAQSAPRARDAEPSPYTLGLLGMVRYGTPLPPEAGARRWSASGWAMLRGSGGGGGVATPQLGGSQVGIRIARTLDRQGRLAMAARVATALDTRQQEAAIGLDWRPSALPLRIVAERRIGLADQRGGTAIGLVGGVSDRPLRMAMRRRER